MSIIDDSIAAHDTETADTAEDSAASSDSDESDESEVFVAINTRNMDLFNPKKQAPEWFRDNLGNIVTLVI